MLAGSEGIWCGVVERELDVQQYEVFRHDIPSVISSTSPLSPKHLDND